MAGVLNATERVPGGEDGSVRTAAPDSVPTPAAPVRFTLPATSDIRVVDELLRLCRGALDAEGDVTVDCGDVERVDAAALQCLGALYRSLAEAERALTFAGPTEQFRQAVEVLGFDALLGLPAAGHRSAP